MNHKLGSVQTNLLQTKVRFAYLQVTILLSFGFLLSACSRVPEPTKVSTAATAVIDVRVMTSSDDAEESNGGKVNLSSATLELTYDHKSPQVVGLRFAKLNIPAGATITAAYLQFTAADPSSDAALLTVRGEAGPNAATFDGSKNDLSARSTTKAGVVWSPAAWNRQGDAGPAQRSPSLVPVIQEIVARSGWAASHPLVILITGTGSRFAKSFDGAAAGAPLLHVEYSTEDVAPPPSTGATLETRVAASSDDAEESVSGSVSLSSSDLELIRESSDQQVGLRFTGLMIPAGATITNAYIQFKTDETTAEATSLKIQGEAADTALTFSSASGNVSARPKTTAFVTWSPTAWSVLGEAGPAQRTPDLAAVIQEVVAGSGWASGNALAVLVTGSGKRVAKSYDGDAAGAPLLHVEYSSSTDPAPSNQVPSVAAGTNQSVTLPSSATLSGQADDDGLPSGILTTRWSQVSGPGTVTFGSATALATTAGFSTAGSYVLRLSASDGALSNSDDINVVVSAAATGAVTIAAAGDIACDPASGSFNGGVGTSSSCKQKATSDLILKENPDAVLTLGDNQYEQGTLAQFQQSYDPSWGRVKAKTYPGIGNHEYLTAGAAGYFDYFGSRAGERSKGYYSFDLGQWHIVALNSNCSKVGGCNFGSPQEAWLKADLAANPAKCTLAYWHHPRFSSGEHGSNTYMSDVWKTLYDAGAEVVLSGHDHDYERFAPQTASGSADAAKGLRQFVVGTGGKNHYAVSGVVANSEVRSDDTHGIIKLTLNPDSYEWQFVPEAGKSFTDSGSASCH